MEYYYVGFDNIYGDELRSLKCHKLGQLTAFKGTVTRTTEVRP
jgi:DNA replication licensing factor MCM6